MEIAKTTQPTLGTWDKLPTENLEKKPKVTFEFNIPVEVKFLSDAPREYLGDNGAYYVFDVQANNADMVIVTSAWTLLRALKTLTPLKGKKVKIVKRLIKGKQGFEIEAVK